MQIHYKENLSQLRKQQLAFTESNIREIDKALLEKNIPKAYYNLLLGAHTDDMKSFAITLLGREVERTLADSNYKISIDEYNINFYTREANIKISLDPNSLRIGIVDNLGDIKLAERAKLYFSDFMIEGWTVSYIK